MIENQEKLRIHKEVHILLHNKFDELMADFIKHTNKLPSNTTLLELAKWSHEQTKNPTRD